MATRSYNVPLYYLLPYTILIHFLGGEGNSFFIVFFFNFTFVVLEKDRHGLTSWRTFKAKTKISRQESANVWNEREHYVAQFYYRMYVGQVRNYNICFLGFGDYGGHAGLVILERNQSNTINDFKNYITVTESLRFFFSL